MLIRKTAKIAHRGIASTSAEMPITLVLGLDAETSPVTSAAKPAATAAKK